MLGTYLMINLLVVIFILKFTFSFFPDHFDIHFPKSKDNTIVSDTLAQKPILIDSTSHPKFHNLKEQNFEIGKESVEHSMIYELLLHIDVGGILTGILGIIVALLIAIVVEDGNKEHEDELAKTIDKIGNGIEKDLKVKMLEILNSNSTLVPKNSLPERIDSFNKIIKLAIENKDDSEIYSINYSGDFGFLRTHNLDVILQNQSKKYEKLSDIKEKDLFYMYDDIKQKNETVKESLKELLKTFNGIYENLHFATMSLNPINKNFTSTFELFLNKVLDGAEIHIYDSLKNEYFETNIDLLNRDNTVHYFFAKSQLTKFDKNKSDKQNIVDYLHNNSVEKVNHSGFPPENIIQLERIPFQFVVCKSKSGKTPSKALISFTNVDALGDNGGMFGFESSDSKIIASLVAIFKNYEKGQLARNEKNNPKISSFLKFQSIFETKNKNEIKTIIKYKEIKENTKEFYQGVPKSDIIASGNLSEIFRENTNIYPIPIYQLKEKPEEICNPKLNNVYLVIGLFSSENRPQTIAEWLSSSKNSKFELIRNSPMHNNKNTIILTDNEGNKFDYSEIWTENENQDYGMLAKIKKENSIYFVCGGINHFGTEKMSEYFKNHWQLISEIEDQNNPNTKVDENEFIIFYSFNLKKNEHETSHVKKHSIIF